MGLLVVLVAFALCGVEGVSFVRFLVLRLCLLNFCDFTRWCLCRDHVGFGIAWGLLASLGFWVVFLDFGLICGLLSQSSRRWCFLFWFWIWLTCSVSGLV